MHHERERDRERELINHERPYADPARHDTSELVAHRINKKNDKKLSIYLVLVAFHFFHGMQTML